MPETTKYTARPLELTELLTLLLEVSERISSTLDLEELMKRIAELVKGVIDYEVFAILLLDEKTQQLKVRFSVGHPVELVQSLRIKVGEGIVGRAAETRQSVLVNDVHQDPAYIQSLPQIRSEMAIPLIVKNRLVGVMDLETPWPDFFTDLHQNLLELLASRMAMAIENARLYRRSLHQARTLQLLADISRELSSVLVLNDLLRRIGTLTKRLIDYHRFSILFPDEQTRTYSAVISLKQDERMPDMCTVGFNQGIVGAAAAAREVIVVPDVTKDPRYVPAGPETRSEMAVPLVLGERVIGVVDLESPQVGYFTAGHVRILSTLAPEIAIAIENARLYERALRSEARMERDLERAREIQLHLMPEALPVIAGLDISARFLPARTLGGDLYDFLAYGKDRHVLAIGDVSGKGAPAALYGAMAIGILRSLAPQRPSAPDMLRDLNRMLLERKIEGHFITMTYAIWEPKTRTLRLANAGMPLPVLVRRGEVRQIHAEGVPLGLLDHTGYQETALKLEKGDMLALFSDGLLEAADPQQEEFGHPRLEKILREKAERPASEIAEAVFAGITRFEHGRPRRDDQTLLVIKVQ